MIWCSTSIELFFATTRIIGYEYKGFEESNTYHLYGFLLSALILIFFISSILSQKVIIKNSDILNFAPIFFVVFSFIAESIIAGEISQTTGKSFLIFIEWSLPAFIGGYYISKEKQMVNAFKYIDIINIILTYSSFLYLSSQFLIYNDENNKELYQMASYRAAYAVGLNMYLLLLPKTAMRFEIFNSRTYKLIQAISIPILLSTSISSGGRGGVILCFLYMVFIPLIFAKKIHINKITFYIFLSFALLIPTIIFFDEYLPAETTDIFYHGLERSIAFIGPDGLNWDGTSGRDLVYDNALTMIANSPFFGYGIFNYKNQAEYPHNLFLELMIGGGLIYLTVAVLFLIVALKKIARFSRINHENKLLIVMMTYPLINLMFSGSYLSNSTLWFFIGFSSALKEKGLTSYNRNILLQK